jgi:hypothetical protein
MRINVGSQEPRKLMVSAAEFFFKKTQSLLKCLMSKNVRNLGDCGVSVSVLVHVTIFLIRRWYDAVLSDVPKSFPSITDSGSHFLK